MSRDLAVRVGFGYRTPVSTTSGCPLLRLPVLATLALGLCTMIAATAVTAGIARAASGDGSVAGGPGLAVAIAAAAVLCAALPLIAPRLRQLRSAARRR